MTTGATSLPDAIRIAVLYQLANIHTSFPGEIVTYDYLTQKATIQPTINKVWNDGTINQMPILTNVPVIFPASGGASLTMPVLPGDTCIVSICERSITEWLISGGLQSPQDPRMLDLTDAVAIIGLKPFNSNFPPRLNNTDMLLSYAGTSITIGIDGSLSLVTQTGNLVNILASGEVKILGAPVKIQTGTTVAIGTPSVELINQLFTVFTALAADVTFFASLLPATQAAITLFIANMASIQGTLP